MEVHSHSHTPRRKWTHYFWEFLMLFLAVFCGFLAEYQLEHKIEKERGKQYIRSFYEDLKKDTARAQERKEMDAQKLSSLASVHACYDTVLNMGDANPCLTTIIRQAFSFIAFVSNDRTIQQLKNAGGMRLLKKEDADSIIAYDNKIRLYTDFESSLVQERQTTVRNNFISMLTFNALRETRSQQDVMIDNNGASYFLSQEPKDVDRFFNEIFMYMVTMNRRQNFLEDIRDHAERLLRFFREKYGFD